MGSASSSHSSSPRHSFTHSKMPKAVPFVPKPAMAKLPLAVRKDIRDNFDAKKDDFQARIKELTGVDFTININAAEVWAYADADNTSAGSCFSGYVEGFISALKTFMTKFEDNGKEFFNAAVTQSELTLTVNTLGDKAETIDSAVKDGVYCILFHQERLGYNQSWLDSTMLPAIESAPREGFSLSAKNSIENDYEAEIEELQEEINKLCGADFTLDPNFEENYKALTAAGDKVSSDWQKSIGGTVLRYFQGLKYQLECQGFKDDTMLQEGLQEVVETKTFKVRVVPKANSTTETVLEDGVIYLQCDADRWGYNANYMGEGLIKLL
ncbi:hypothetical protein MSAN_00684300 [Mycena sanguinolenta]|uniref:Uncharacterized protein n=1 Tax=Mycena sanguinolenta TaxID=230812 RepID=A0A8H6Z1J0_9AGAR|nr:hypothetical protein MSAN_00684300 [Mycena sanguinolenta]